MEDTQISEVSVSETEAELEQKKESSDKVFENLYTVFGGEEGEKNLVESEFTESIANIENQELVSFETSGFEVAVIYCFGIMVGLMFWASLSRKWYA